MQNRYPRWLTPVAALLVAALLAACGQPPAQVFDPALWQNTEAHPEADRAAMLADLTARYPLQRYTRPQVRQLLGKPEAYTDTPANEDWYLLALEYDGIEPDAARHLVFRYAPNGDKVVQVGIDQFARKQGHRFHPL